MPSSMDNLCRFIQNVEKGGALMEEERARVAVSVRTLVEFVWKRGSIRSGSVPTVKYMQ